MAGKRELLKAMSRLADRLGAEVMLDTRPREGLSAKDRVLGRREVRLPASWPVGAARALVVQDYAYGPERGEWNRDRAARMLKRGLLAAGWDHRECAYVSIFPEERKEGAVSSARLLERRGLLLEAVRAADSDAVILLGSMARQLWHPHATRMPVDGRVGCWTLGDGTRWVLCVAHPGAVAQGIAEFNTWSEQLARFRQGLDENLAGFMLDNECTACENEVHVYDTYGMGWCRRHMGSAADALTRKIPPPPQATSLFDQGESDD